MSDPYDVIYVFFLGGSQINYLSRLSFIVMITGNFRYSMIERLPYL